jgi:hypothetical protein
MKIGALFILLACYKIDLYEAIMNYSVFLKSLFLCLLLAFSSFCVDTRAESQLRHIWKLISESEYKELPPFSASTFSDTLKLLRPSYSSQAFVDEAILKDGRRKIIHTLGSVILVKYVATNHSYSGIFESGALGLMRLSLATAPSEDNYTPGFGLMFFIDNMPPLSILAMPSIDAQTVPNIFLNSYLTALKTPKSKFSTWLLNHMFTNSLERLGFFEHDPLRLSVSHLAEFLTDGTKAKTVRAPFELIFTPTVEAINLLYGIRDNDDFRVKLANKGKDKPLFDVYAKDKNSDQVLIGQLIGISNFKSSKFGDEKLHFKHPEPHKKEKSRECCGLW